MVGLRPTFERVSNANALGLTVDFDTIGPLARSVSDIALAFAAIAGYNFDDPENIAIPVENFLPTLQGCYHAGNIAPQLKILPVKTGSSITCI